MYKYINQKRNLKNRIDNNFHIGTAVLEQEGLTTSVLVDVVDNPSGKHRQLSGVPLVYCAPSLF